MMVHSPILHQDAPKTLMVFMTALLAAYLLVGFYHSYKKTEFQSEVNYLYGENHYKLRQMASTEILCRDSKHELCFCGHC